MRLDPIIYTPKGFRNRPFLLRARARRLRLNSRDYEFIILEYTYGTYAIIREINPPPPPNLPKHDPPIYRIPHWLFDECIFPHTDEIHRILSFNKSGPGKRHPKPTRTFYKRRAEWYRGHYTPSFRRGPTM